MGLRDDAQLDFRQYGILPWLAERAEQLGFSYPTGELRWPIGPDKSPCSTMLPLQRASWVHQPHADH